MWRCSKLCSHTIACAFLDGNLQQFISHVTGQPSFYAPAKSGTAGKKPSKKHKASSKSTTRALATLQSEITPVQVGYSALPPSSLSLPQDESYADVPSVASIPMTTSAVPSSTPRISTPLNGGQDQKYSKSMRMCFTSTFC
jgi:hypothetical protein